MNNNHVGTGKIYKKINIVEDVNIEIITFFETIDKLIIIAAVKYAVNKCNNSVKHIYSIIEIFVFTLLYSIKFLIGLSR
jgi:hypothetical protein